MMVQNGYLLSLLDRNPPRLYIPFNRDNSQNLFSIGVRKANVFVKGVITVHVQL